MRDGAPVTDEDGVRAALAAVGVKPTGIEPECAEFGVWLVASPDLDGGDYLTDGPWAVEVPLP